MTPIEITNIGKELTKRRLRGALRRKLQEERPTLAHDTVWRAFRETGCNTDTLDWIRNEARLLLEGKGVVITGVFEGA